MLKMARRVVTVASMRHLQIKMDLSRQLEQIGALENQLDQLLRATQPSPELAANIDKLQEEKTKLNYQIDILRRAIKRLVVLKFL